MKRTRMMKLRFRQLKELAKGAIIHIAIGTVLVLGCIWLAAIDNDRPWTYEECTWTYRHYSPEYQARECNHLRNN